MTLPVYLFSPQISFKAFKSVYDKFSHGGIVPQHADKIMWQIIRDKRLHCYIDPAADEDDPVIFALKLPKKRAIVVLK